MNINIASGGSTGHTHQHGFWHQHEPWTSTWPPGVDPYGPQASTKCRATAWTMETSMSLSVAQITHANMVSREQHEPWRLFEEFQSREWTGLYLGLLVIDQSQYDCVTVHSVWELSLCKLQCASLLVLIGKDMVFVLFFNLSQPSPASVVFAFQFHPSPPCTSCSFFHPSHLYILHLFMQVALQTKL